MDREEVKTKLREFILTELVNRPDYPLKDDEGLISGGLMDSFSLAQVGVFVEDEWDIYIPDPDLTVENMDTLDQMVDRIMEG